MAPSSPEILARRWVPGDGPVEIQPLGMGLVNSSWRVARDGKLYSLRVAACDSRELGVDREWEMRVLQAAAAADIAPSVACCDPAEGILVSEWLTGETWTAAQVSEADNQVAMAQLLRRVHALPIFEPARVMTPAAWITHYRSALASRFRGAAAGAHGPADALVDALVDASVDGWEGTAEKMLASIAGSATAEPVMCHSDLHRLNVSVGTRIRLLDWEYAHVSDGYWDLAGWAGNNDWSAAESEGFLDHYLERSATSSERALLHVWVWLYDYVSLLWSSLYLTQRPGSPNREVRDRSDVIAARLKDRVGGRSGQVPAH